MSEKDQERLEEYLELEHCIQKLQAGHRPLPSRPFAPHTARIYRMVLLFGVTSSEGAEPRPEFIAALWARLEPRLREPPRRWSFSFLPQQARKKPRSTLRRGLLARGIALVASLIIGASVGWVAERLGNHKNSDRRGSTDIGTHATDIPLLAGVSTAWHFVTTLSLLDHGAQRFATNTIVGYVLRDAGDNGDQKQGQVIALSAACTHMGCLVQWQNADRKFHCPCHGVLFIENGLVDKSSNLRGYLPPLPRLETKVEGGKVYVRVPVSQR